MGDKLIENYLNDLLDCIKEIEQVRRDAKSLAKFKKSVYYIRATERIFSIMGEILKKISDMRPEMAGKIGSRKKIIGLRNFLAHAYETVDHEEIWSCVVKHTPELKADIVKLKKALKGK